MTFCEGAEDNNGAVAKERGTQNVCRVEPFAKDTDVTIVKVRLGQFSESLIGALWIGLLPCCTKT